MPELYDVTVQTSAITANGVEFKFQNVGGTLALLGDVAAVSGALGGRVGNLEQINEDTNEPTGFVDRTSSVLTFNNSTRTFNISGTYGVYCDGVKFIKTGETQVINNTHGMHYFYYDPNGSFVYSDGTAWSILAPDAMIASVYWDAQSQLGILIEERHGCILDAATHYYNHNLYGTQRLTAGVIGGFTVQNSLSNSAIQIFIGPTTLADEDIIYTTVSNMISGSYRFAYRSGASNWVVSATSNVPVLYDGTNIIKFNSLSGSNYSMQDIITAGTNTFVNYYVVASTSVSGAYSYVLVPGQTTHATLALAQGEAFNNLNLTNFPFIEFNAVYQLTFRYSNSYSGLSGRARLEANPVLLGLRSSTQSVAPVTTHNALAGLQGGTTGEYFHLTSSQYIDYIGASTVAAISGGLNTILTTVETSISGITGGIQQLDARFVNLTSAQTISGNKSFHEGIAITPDIVSLSGSSLDLVVRGTSTGTSYVTLGVRNSGTGIAIPTNSAVSFNVQFTGINTDGSGEVGAFILTGVIRNTAGTTALQGSPTSTIISRPGVQWAVRAIANDTSDTLEIQAKGPSATTIKWAAKATIVWIGL